MAEVSIKDGGSGNIAQVDINNRIHVQALTVDATLNAHLNSNGYDVSTAGLINLTGTTISALLYISNTGDPDLIIDTIFVDIATSNGGSGEGLLTWHLNPTGGTLLDNASAAQEYNRRIGSPVNLSVDAYKATATGKTLTGGDTINFPFPSGLSVPFGRPFIIPKGQAFGVSYTPPGSNVDVDAQIGFLIIVDTTRTV